jgi:dual-specificity kinase
MYMYDISWINYLSISWSNCLDKILKLLGQGTFGKVVECWDRQTYTRVAVKIIRAVEKYREAAKKEVCILNTLLQNDRNNSKYVRPFIGYVEIKSTYSLSFDVLHTRFYPFYKIKKDDKW